MEIRIVNSANIVLDILEGVESVLWIERFNDPGEFEIVAKYTDYLSSLLQIDYYLTNSDSEASMIIESVQIITNPETGDKLIVKGRSLGSALDRRIVLKQIQITNGLQNGIQALLNENVINSVYPERNFPNFTFSASIRPEITGIPLTAQYYSQNLLEVIMDICKQNNVGFKVRLNSTNGVQTFSLYLGADRSFTANLNQNIMIFSPKFENLLDSDYIHDKSRKKNFILVSGDPASNPYGTGGYPDRVQVWTNDVGTGYSRREMFLDVTDMPVKNENTGNTIPQVDYEAQLTQRGKEELAKNIEYTYFNGTIDFGNKVNVNGTPQSYRYNTDFFLGDFVQLMDNYGHSVKVRIIEVVLSDSIRDGFKIYPRLESV